MHSNNKINPLGNAPTFHPYTFYLYAQIAKALQYVTKGPLNDSSQGELVLRSYQAVRS
jgi:hypothetical protein